MKFTLGFSPCPNDTFIFDALVNKKIDTHNLNFDVVLEDVETLNQWALQGKFQLTKLSYGVLPLVLDTYAVLNSGSALGKGVGPLLISKEEAGSTNVEDSLIAIPGENTTAHLLFSLAYPNVKKKKYMVFHEIENAILNGIVDAGVIIHENRFTYEQKGLKKIMDLGEYWEQQLQIPIPLGGIVAHHRLSENTRLQVDQLIRKSVEYAFEKYPLISEYVQLYAQEMEQEVMKQHIDLYVNNYSINLGAEGRAAIEKLLEVARKGS